MLEPSNMIGKCPACGKPVPKRSTREKPNYCSRTCASNKRYMTRYIGTESGPAERPKATEKLKY